MNRIEPEELKRLREQYPRGCRVKLIHMNDPYCLLLQAGSLGTVTHVDDIGTIHVSWDSGSSLGILFREDYCIRLDALKNH